ncbi:hypothetical protein EWB00_000818 [Schistosoma japonicum]|uniref:Uncharacterized protein n=1 Tax=Schistosoma japonicum TaxID=6182 RepID=A0A4Z2CKU7_SCHJA|nr:hypothetical protein EWB00_000818 [Schistosoma japonicum]
MLAAPVRWGVLSTRHGGPCLCPGGQAVRWLSRGDPALLQRQLNSSQLREIAIGRERGRQQQRQHAQGPAHPENAYISISRSSSLSPEAGSCWPGPDKRKPLPL